MTNPHTLAPSPSHPRPHTSCPGEPAIAKLLRTSLRYFSVLDVDTPLHAPPSVALLFKNEVQETWVGGLASADGLTFEGEPRLVYPKHARR